MVLLAHEAAVHLEGVVSGWAAFLNGLGRTHELILVDDGSTDGTAARLTALTARHPNLRVLSHDRPQGEGAALRTGLAATQYPLLFYTLADPRYRPEDLGLLLHKRHPPQMDPEIDHVHLLSGYRAGWPVPFPWRMVGWLWRGVCRVVFSFTPAARPGWLGWRRHAGQLLVRALFAVRYQDVACPYRLLRREVFTNLPIQSDGPFVHVEVLAKANFLGHIMGEEVPLAVTPHDAGNQPRATPREVCAEAYRVFSAPDFGIGPTQTEQRPLVAAEQGPDSPRLPEESILDPASGARNDAGEHYPN